MNKKETFIKEIEDLINTNKIVLSEDAAIFFAALKETKDKEKPEFTENGKRILLFIKEHYKDFDNLFKAKDIGEQMDLSSKTVSGGMRKLVTDGYIEKIGEHPSIYSLTTLGKEVKINLD